MCWTTTKTNATIHLLLTARNHLPRISRFNYNKHNQTLIRRPSGPNILLTTFDNPRQHIFNTNRYSTCVANLMTLLHNCPRTFRDGVCELCSIHSEAQSAQTYQTCQAQPEFDDFPCPHELQRQTRFNCNLRTISSVRFRTNYSPHLVPFK